MNLLQLCCVNSLVYILAHTHLSKRRQELPLLYADIMKIVLLHIVHCASSSLKGPACLPLCASEADKQYPRARALLTHCSQSCLRHYGQYTWAQALLTILRHLAHVNSNHVDRSRHGK